MNLFEQFRVSLEQKSLLKHPFYQQWDKGILPREALVEYAKEYYHFMNHFPRFVAAIYANCEDEKIRRTIIHNLVEEELGDYNNVNPHAEQWLRFCEGLGITREEITLPQNEKTKSLLATLERLTKKDFFAGVAAAYAYESQVSEIARKKKEGLMAHYGFTEQHFLQFFDTHMEADIEHAKVWKNLLAAVPEERRAEILQHFNESLDAQWGFLDGMLESTA